MKKIPLICLPYAGAGASFYRPWKSIVSDVLEIVPIQLPGREERFVEEPYRDVAQAVTGIIPEVLMKIKGCNKIAIFGHSMGAILAYELANRIMTTTKMDIVLLVVSGSPSPLSKRSERVSELKDQDFLNRIEAFVGYQHDALKNPDMRELLLPLFRADVEMHENYSPIHFQALPIFIMAVRGNVDTLVSSEQIAEWQSVTTRALQKTELAGGHMYLIENPEKLLRAIEEKISTMLAINQGK